MSTFVFKNLRQLFDKYAVARTEHDALVKSMTKIFFKFVAFSENPNFTYNIRYILVIDHNLAKQAKSTLTFVMNLFYCKKLGNDNLIFPGQKD